MDPIKKLIPFLTFVLIASPQMFQFTSALGGSWIASPEGLPRVGGLLLHALVFVLLTHLLWRLAYGPKKVNGCGCSA